MVQKRSELQSKLSCFDVRVSHSTQHPRKFIRGNKVERVINSNKPSTPLTISLPRRCLFDKREFRIG